MAAKTMAKPGISVRRPPEFLPVDVPDEEDEEATPPVLDDEDDEDEEEGAATAAVPFTKMLPRKF